MQLLEEEEVEVPVTKEAPKEANKMETDEASSEAAPPTSADCDVNMQDPKGPTDNGVSESPDKTAPMETDTKVDCYFCNKKKPICSILLLSCICFFIRIMPEYPISSHALWCYVS